MSISRRYKIGWPNPVDTHMKWTPVFEWRVIRCESKNGHKKTTCLNDIGLCVQILLTILNHNSIIYIVGWIYEHIL